MNYAVLLAGGKGTRLGLPTPKQFLKLGDKTILQHTVEKFVISPDIFFTVVVVPEAWYEHSVKILGQLPCDKVGVCVGGDSRQESLYNGLVWLQNKFDITEEDIAVSHDIARPFVTLQMISENIRVCKENGAADTVIPATDTIVVSRDGEEISYVPVRKEMYLGQTPQTFFIKKFLSIYASLDKNYLSEVTDAARILCDNGVSVGLVLGDVSNIKVTTIFDLKVAELVLEK